MQCDILGLARALGEAASALISPGNILVVDESLYEFNGDCPVKRFIPRKPHPNGLLVYGLAGYFNVNQHQLPYVLDFEPYVLDNKVSAQDAMMLLFRRLRQHFPHITPHLVVDSAFGSFGKLNDIVAAGGHATMSMAPIVKPWLWELLDFNCGIDEGRLAFLPADNVVISSFKVLSESGKEHQIKTISSGCNFEEDGEEEEIVVGIRQRRVVVDELQYLTEFMDGHTDWLTAEQFIDTDGTTNLTWLNYVDNDDLSNTFLKFTHNQLKVRYFSSSFSLVDLIIGHVQFPRLEINRGQSSSSQAGHQEAEVSFRGQRGR